MNVEIGGLRISNNEISKERYEGFTRAFDRLKEKFKPIKFAVNLFGSLVQGKFLTGGHDGNWQTSDIDAKLRFDVDDVLECLKQGSSPLKEFLSATESTHILQSGNMNKLSQIFLDEFKDLLIEEVPHMGANKKLTDNLKIYPISMRPDSWCFVGHDFELKRVASWFFGDDIGGNMRQYIKSYLGYLMQNFSIEDREKKWAEVVHNTETYIRSDLKDISPYKQIPKTFSEAVEYFV
jgi:hypothetical protein